MKDMGTHLAWSFILVPLYHHEIPFRYCIYGWNPLNSNFHEVVAAAGRARHASAEGRKRMPLWHWKTDGNGPFTDDLLMKFHSYISSLDNCVVVSIAPLKMWISPPLFHLAKAECHISMLHATAQSQSSAKTPATSMQNWRIQHVVLPF